MTIKSALILAALQGITEFIPISSSGHLVVLQNILKLKDVPILFDLILHLGTVLATIIVYHKIIGNILFDLFLWIKEGKQKRKYLIARGNVKLFFYILISTFITGILGYAFKDILKDFFYQPDIVPLFLILTGIILLTTRFVHTGKKEISQINIIYPVVIGGTQAFSMLPGISRSGSTISAGLFMGSSRGFSGIYSFLVSIPSILGASIFEFLSTRPQLHCYMGSGLYFLAFFTSFLTGYGALRLLLRFLTRGKLYIFSIYCFLAGITGLMIYYY